MQERGESKEKEKMVQETHDEVSTGFGSGDIALDGDPIQRGTAPNFQPMSVVSKRLDGSFKMPLGTKVGLGPGYIVLDGDPAPPKRGTAPNFRSMYVMVKRLNG